MGQILAVRHPDRLIDLTLVNTVGYDFWPVPPITILRTPVVRELLMASLDLGALTLLVRRGLHHRGRCTAELMALFERPLETPEGRKAFLHFARCLDNRDLMDIASRIPQLTLPVLIVRGTADQYLSAAIAARLHREISGSRLVEVATAGHFFQEDEPERLAGLILDFILRKP